MTSETTPKSKLKQRGHEVVEWAKIISACLLLLSFASSAWTQFFGPGIQPALQSFLGIDTLREQNAETLRLYREESRMEFEALRNENVLLRDQIETLISYIEPPRVVVWQRIRQIGACTSLNCEFDITFARTQFGVDCGIPSVYAEMRLNEGLPFDLQLGNFRPIEGQISGSRVTVPVTIRNHIPEGRFEWRVVNTYPDCAFPGEPIPRKSPWWPIHVTQP